MNVYHDKTEHFNALQKYLCTPFKIINGDGFVEVKGELIPAKIYDEHNERPTYEAAAKPNPDGKNIPMGVIPYKSKK